MAYHHHQHHRTSGMGTGGVDPFAEHGSLMKELYHEYQKRDDFDNIAAVEALLAETHRLAATKEGSVQAVISSECVAIGGRGGLAATLMSTVQ
eukprot:364378-Chlamydomonas_euryale.AAC.8